MCQALEPEPRTKQGPLGLWSWYPSGGDWRWAMNIINEWVYGRSGVVRVKRRQEKEEELSVDIQTCGQRRTHGGGDIWAETLRKGEDEPWEYLGEEASSRRSSQCRELRTGMCQVCSRNSSAAGVAGIGGARGERLGQGLIAEAEDSRTIPSFLAWPTRSTSLYRYTPSPIPNFLR